MVKRFRPEREGNPISIDYFIHNFIRRVKLNKKTTYFCIKSRVESIVDSQKYQISAGVDILRIFRPPHSGKSGFISSKIDACPPVVACQYLETKPCEMKPNILWSPGMLREW